MSEESQVPQLGENEYSPEQLDALAGVTPDDANTILTREVVLERLALPFPESAIERVVKGKQQFSYVNHAVVTRRLNWATGNAWSWDIDQIHFRTDGAIKQWADKNTGELPPEAVVMVVVGRLTIPILGTNGENAHRVGIGVHPIQRGGGEDQYKGANSDALKNAAYRFGPGLQLYRADIENLANRTEETAQETKSPTPIRKPRAEKALPVGQPQPDKTAPDDVTDVIAELVKEKERIGVTAIKEYSTSMGWPAKKMSDLTPDQQKTLLTWAYGQPNRAA